MTIDKNLKICPRFDKCSANICPLDSEANLRNKLVGEESCPFTINKRGKGQKGIKTLASDSILELIPKPNVKLLHKRNQKRWHSLHKKDERK